MKGNVKSYMKVRLGAKQHNIDNFIDKVQTKYHFDKKDSIDLKRIYMEMLKLIDAKAIYKINQRVTGIKEIDDNQAAVVAITLGNEIDRLQEKYTEEQQITEAYMVDCIGDELLLSMYKEFNEVYARYHRRYVRKYVFIGNEISLEKIPQILEDLFEEKNNKLALDKEADKQRDKSNADDNLTALGKREIKANEYGVLTPQKSVLFYAVLSENPEEKCEGICLNCGNVTCENRIEAEVTKKPTVDISSFNGLNYGFQRIFCSNK